MQEIFVLGMIVGAAVAHNFAMASSSKGVAAFGRPPLSSDWFFA